MESQQDIVDLTINDGEDCFFLTGPLKLRHLKVSMDRKTANNC